MYAGLSANYYCVALMFQDKQADLIIHAYVDDVMIAVMKSLDITIPKFQMLQTQ